MSKRTLPLSAGIIYCAVGIYYILMLSVFSRYDRSTLEIALAQSFAYPLLIFGVAIGGVLGNALGIASHRLSRNDNRKPHPKLIMLVLGGITVLLALLTVPGSVAATLYFDGVTIVIRTLPFNVAFVASAYLVAGIRCLIRK